MWLVSCLDSGRACETVPVQSCSRKETNFQLSLPLPFYSFLPSLVPPRRSERSSAEPGTAFDNAATAAGSSASLALCILKFRNYNFVCQVQSGWALPPS